MSEKRKTSDAVRILEKTFGTESRRKRRAIEREKEYIEIAEQIYALRTEAKLTQAELAAKVGTKQSVISRLESADYGRYSMKMLDKIAEAMHCRVEVRLVPIEGYYAIA